MANTTGKWSFNSIAQTILIGFSAEFLYVKILALGRGVSSLDFYVLPTEIIGKQQ